MKQGVFCLKTITYYDTLIRTVMHPKKIKYSR